MGRNAKAGLACRTDMVPAPASLLRWRLRVELAVWTVSWHSLFYHLQGHADLSKAGNIRLLRK